MEQDIRIDTIHLDREHLRDTVTDESVTQLADDIKDRGLLQAIVVRAREGGGWRLVAGRRRLTACKLIGYTTIPARIIEGTDLDEVDGLQENLMRVQMNPLEEAKAVYMLHEKKDLSIAEICRRLKRGTSWVQDRLMLYHMPEPFREAVAEKRLSISAAAQLLLIEDEPYRDYLLGVAKINGATVHQCEAWLLDWKARMMLTNPAGQPGAIPQPMPPPSDPLMTCNLCDEAHPLSSTTLLRVCQGCHQTVADALTGHSQEPPQGGTHENAQAIG